MAVFRWRGNGAGTKSAVNDGRNWVDNVGIAYDQATYPGSSGIASDDEVVFDTALGATDAAPAGYTVTTQLAKLSVMPAYNQGIGGADGPLVAGADVLTIQAAAAKTLYINSYTGGFGSATVLDGPLTSVLGGDHVVILKGKVTILTGSTISGSLLIGYISSQTGDARVTIQSGVSLPSAVKVYGGTTTSLSSPGELTLTGGIWSQDADTFGHVTIYNGSVLWNGSGYLSYLWIYGGSFDCSNAQSSRRIGTAYVHPAGYLNLDSGAETVTVIEHIDCQGGRTDFPVGQKIARALTDNYRVNGSNAPFGIEPQSIGNGATVVGSGFRCQPTDKVVVFAMVGAGGVAGGTVSFALYAASSNTFSDEESVGSCSVEGEHRGDSFRVEATEFPAGKRWLRVKATNNLVGGVPASAACQVTARTP